LRRITPRSALLLRDQLRQNVYVCHRHPLFPPLERR
jgi:hypothetical protein